ncbi:hypothetical protein C8A00DRAFT_14098 [Chaetomidium leptoderma]|uniref:Uncharacterized protein n=1 Tax=Chaetomidium leptoderma TaxID=669021 RepID=A0AAN6VNH1_9PEZI|nr:hypothetical protein C8A00DRAFT_14098 [Chaetomidium leptoderma]
MLRRLISNALILAGLGLVIGAYAAPKPPQLSSTSTSTAATTTSTAAATKYCPWCAGIPTDDRETFCKLVIQVPAKFGRIMDYPALIFNHNLTALLYVDMLSTITITRTWQLDATKTGDSNLDVVLLAVEGWESNTDKPPKLAYGKPGYTHTENWFAIPNAGEMGFGIQSTVFHTSFQCAHA